MTPRKPKAVRAREMRAKHPEMPAAEIAHRLGITRQAVHDALRTTGQEKRGRPSEGAAVLLRERDLEADVLERARAAAEAEGVEVEVAEVLVRALSARFGG